MLRICNDLPADSSVYTPRRGFASRPREDRRGERPPGIHSGRFSATGRHRSEQLLAAGGSESRVHGSARPHHLQLDRSPWHDGFVILRTDRGLEPRSDVRRQSRTPATEPPGWRPCSPSRRDPRFTGRTPRTRGGIPASGGTPRKQPGHHPQSLRRTCLRLSGCRRRSARNSSSSRTSRRPPWASLTPWWINGSRRFQPSSFMWGFR